MKEPCRFCCNARVCDELTDDNDYAALSIPGIFPKGTRMMLVSGWRRPIRIEAEQWSEEHKQWETYSVYFPKFCPECGRELLEYDRNKYAKDAVKSSDQGGKVWKYLI